MKSRKGQFNWTGFSESLDRRIREEGLTSTMLAREMDGKPGRAKIWEIRNGKPCSVEVFLFLCQRFGLEPFDYLVKT